MVFVNEKFHVRKNDVLALKGPARTASLYAPLCCFQHPLDISHPRKRTGHLGENNS